LARDPRCQPFRQAANEFEAPLVLIEGALQPHKLDHHHLVVLLNTFIMSFIFKPGQQNSIQFHF
jgi:hypothetical protein